MSILEKLAAVRAARAGEVRASLVATDARWPSLLELLTVSEHPEGGKRQLSRLTLFLDRNVIKAAITEPTLAASAFASGASLGDALDALERRLTENDPDTWTPWANGTPPWERKRK